MRDLAELHMKPLRSKVFASISDDLVASFEKWANHRLPKDYVAFLRQCNGGYTTFNEYVDMNGIRQEMNNFYGLGTQEADHATHTLNTHAWDNNNLWGETRIMQTILGNRGIPFARDGGGNWLFLDYDAGPEPCVSQIICSTRNIVPVALSFGEFIDLLHPIV